MTCQGILEWMNFLFPSWDMVGYVGSLEGKKKTPTPENQHIPLKRDLFLFFSEMFILKPSIFREIHVSSLNPKPSGCPPTITMFWE